MHSHLGHSERMHREEPPQRAAHQTRGQEVRGPWTERTEAQGNGNREKRTQRAAQAYAAYADLSGAPEWTSLTEHTRRAFTLLSAGGDFRAATSWPTLKAHWTFPDLMTLLGNVPGRRRGARSAPQPRLPGIPETRSWTPHAGGSEALLEIMGLAGQVTTLRAYRHNTLPCAAVIDILGAAQTWAAQTWTAQTWHAHLHLHHPANTPTPDTDVRALQNAIQDHAAAAAPACGHLIWTTHHNPTPAIRPFSAETYLQVWAERQPG